MKAPYTTVSQRKKELPQKTRKTQKRLSKSHHLTSVFSVASPHEVAGFDLIPSSVVKNSFGVYEEMKVEILCC
jgi:hypothetical protein